jgi:hypothetical protein
MSKWRPQLHQCNICFANHTPDTLFLSASCLYNSKKNQPVKPHITFKNNVIAYNSELKFLGLCITETLTWQAQIHSLCTILSWSYYMIKSLKNVTSTQTIWNIYFAHFESRLRYGIMFWGGDEKSIRIFWLQNKVIKLITGVHKRKSCRPILRKFKILTLASLHIFEMLNFLKKY